jgi:AraC family transcriptional regulator
MHAWEAIQKSLDYIEDNLSEDIEIETLANVAALSPYYFQRLFRRLVRKPVNEYVKLRRLAKASETLENKEKRIMDVALDCGFSDHANFTRTFKGAYGITPEKYRDCPVILNQFIKPDLILNYVMVDEDVPLIADGIVVEVTRRNLDEPRTFIGIAGEVPVSELAGGRTTGVATTGRIWNYFHRQKPNIPYLLPNGNEFGVLYMGDAKEGHCAYMAGAEATKEATAKGYTSYTLLCGEYVVCCFEAENFAELIGSAVFKASSFMNGWMKKHGLTCGDFAAEMYYDTDPDSSYMELWLPLSSSQRELKLPETWDKTDGTQEPTLKIISAYVKSPLWERLCKHVEEQYQIKPVLEYSGCSLQQGWNVKYKKAGRSLCTLYPMEGYYIALVVVGERERAETELALPFFTEYLQQLYRETKTGMGQKWLMINVTNDAVLEDVKQCIAIRRGIKKK